MGMVYRWADRAHSPAGISAQVAGEEIERVRSKLGFITPLELLDASRQRDSRLHSAFEWNDSVAGERYRQEQARHIIKAVIVEISQKDEGSVEVRAFVSVRPETDSGKPSFTSLGDAMADSDLREQVVIRAYQELRGWHKRYSVYQELAEAAREIEAQIEAFASRRVQAAE
jgi:hypothetical protein